MEFFATAGNIPVHIYDSKVGDKCIFLLHGYLETMYIWSEFNELLTKEYRVISIDLPGHGLTSSAPVNTMEFIATVAKDVLGICGVDTATVAGHSLGGYVALTCCRLFPETFTKLVLLNSHPYPDLPEKAEDRAREISIIESGRLEALATVSIPKMYNSESLRLFDEKIRETVELCETHDPEGIAACIKGMMQRIDSTEYLKGTSTPVLGVMGDRDLFIPLDMIEKMKKDFPKVRFEVIPDCGHNSFIEKKDVVMQLLKEFV